MLTVVMPAFNEEDLLEASVRDVVKALWSGTRAFELLVVENGSTDRTPEIAEALASELAEVRVRHLPEANYGAALRTGLLEAVGDRVVFFDVDYYDARFLEDALPLLDAPDNPAVIVVASKRAPGAHDGRPMVRRAATSIFDAILRVSFGIRTSDTHGMKALQRDSVLPFVALCEAGPDLFDTELVLRAERAGLKIAEIPASVTEQRPARIPILARVPRTLVGLARLRRGLRGETRQD